MANGPPYRGRMLGWHMAEVLIHLKVAVKQENRKEPVQDSPLKDPHPCGTLPSTVPCLTVYRTS